MKEKFEIEKSKLYIIIFILLLPLITLGVTAFPIIKDFSDLQIELIFSETSYSSDTEQLRLGINNQSRDSKKSQKPS